MKRLLTLLVALAFVAPAMADDTKSEGNDNKMAAAPSSEWDTLSDTWFFQDAIPVSQGMVDLRLSFGWQTGSWPSNGGDSDDDFVATPSIYWGFADNWEASVNLPMWLGDGGDRGGYADGNYDANVGVLWRFAKQDDGHMMDMALAGNFRLPTGNGSSGIDYEGRLAMTHTYACNARSHLNVWGKITNGDDHESARGLRNNNSNGIWGGGFGIANSWRTNRLGWDDERNWQYGADLGFDFPFCDNGNVRMVFDYLTRTSIQEGQNWWHILQTGWEWKINDADRFGTSFFYNFDQSTDAPNAGMTFTFAHALTY